MPRGRKLQPLALDEEHRKQLESWRRSTSMPQGLVMRAGIVLASAEGLTNVAVAKRLGVANATVGKWRKRFLEAGIQGLHDEARPGRPRTHDDEKVAAVIQRALKGRADDEGPWSVRKMADSEGVSKSTVQRWFSLFGVKPHLAKTFKLSTDPFFVEKVRDITALYLNPPDHAVVLAVDERSQVQALDRTQPILPLGLGHAEGFTHDYIRHGTTTLFAALDIATGKVVARCHKRHRHQEWLSFLRVIDRETPAELDVHIVCDKLRHPQAHERPRLARQEEAVPHALHADLRLLAESGRALVRHTQPARNQAFGIPERDRPQAEDPQVHGGVQQDGETVRMGCHCRIDLREARSVMHTY